MHSGETSVSRRQATAGIRPVHHIVVNEGARLQEFQARDGVNDGRLLGRTQGDVSRGAPPAPVRERRTQSLSAGKEIPQRGDEGFHIRADVRQQRALSGENVVDRRLNAWSKVRCVQRSPDQFRREIRRGIRHRASVASERE